MCYFDGDAFLIFQLAATLKCSDSLNKLIVFPLVHLTITAFYATMQASRFRRIVL